MNSNSLTFSLAGGALGSLGSTGTSDVEVDTGSELFCLEMVVESLS